MNFDKLVCLCEINFGKDIIDSRGKHPVISPNDEETASEIIKFANMEKCKLIPAGGRTFPFPFDQESSLVLSSRKMTGVAEINHLDFTVIVNSGTIVKDVVIKAGQEGLLIPIDPVSRDNSTIGGAFMTGAEGPLATGYGPLKKLFTGIRCISPEGKVIVFGGKTAKNVTGYDGVNFLYATMGIFGFISGLTIKAKSLPETSKFIRAVMKDFHKLKAAMELMAPVIGSPSIFDIAVLPGSKPVVWLGYHGLEKIVDKNIKMMIDILERDGAEKIEPAGEEFFYTERAAISSEMISSDFYTFCMNPASVKYFLLKASEYEDRLSIAAHPFTGKVHIKCSDDSIVKELAVHSGVMGGKEPLEWEHYIRKGFSGLFSDKELTIAKALKKELDPNNIMNSDMGI